MSNPTKRIIEQVPVHYREQAAGFILFLEKYYEWLYRESGFTQQEVDSLKSDTSWITDNIELFSKTGSAKDLVPSVSDENSVIRAIIDYDKYRNPGDMSQNLQTEYLMEDDFYEFITADDEYFTDSTGVFVDSPNKNDVFIDEWYRLNNYMRPKTIDLTRIDEVLFVSLLKHINAIKGTQKSIELFFNIFFQENDVIIYIPKFDIAIIDDNWIPDVHGVVRDDNYYDEFTYVVRVNNTPDTYQPLFNEVFMKYIHPMGFTVVLEQKH